MTFLQILSRASQILVLNFLSNAGSVLRKFFDQNTKCMFWRAFSISYRKSYNHIYIFIFDEYIWILYKHISYNNHMHFRAFSSSTSPLSQTKKRSEIETTEKMLIANSFSSSRNVCFWKGVNVYMPLWINKFDTSSRIQRHYEINESKFMFEKEQYLNKDLHFHDTFSFLLAVSPKTFFIAPWHLNIQLMESFLMSHHSQSLEYW